MTNQGKFITFKCYTNDLMMAQSGLYELVPSRFIVLQKNANAGEEFDNHLTGLDISNNDEYHRAIREAMYKNFTASEKNGNVQTTIQQCAFGGIISSGDVNMLSHDFIDGVMFNEVYVHVNGEDAMNRTVMLSNPTTNSDFSTLAKPCFERKTGETGIYSRGVKQDRNTPDYLFEFDGVLVLYNVWNRVDKTLKYADVPMGIYELNDKQVLYMTKESNYGSGTSWATRISTAMPFIGGRSAVQAEDQSTSYNTMIAAISKLGECVASMQKIVAIKAGELEEKKARLAEFKNNRHVNVPYIVGNTWYVNGHYICPAANVSKEMIADAIKTMDLSDIIKGDGDCGPGCDSGSYDKFIEEVSKP